MGSPLVVFDIDGTLTDFNKYVREKAIPYFENKLHMKVVDPNALEVEEIFDIRNTFIREGLSEEAAIQREKKLLNKYWISHRFIGFTLLVRYRKYSSAFIKWLLKNGFDVQLHSSRAKCTNKDLIGSIARGFTILQCWTNGLFLSPSRFHFYKDDTSKVNGIISQNPKIAFDDKTEIIDALNTASIRTCRVIGTHNRAEVADSNMNIDISSYELSKIKSSLTTLIGKRYWAYILREAHSAKFLHRIEGSSVFLMKKFQPVIMNEQNLANDKIGIIYAPNHIRTVDPLVIEGITKRNIHWVALKRFFDGNDSIFNNSKNPILCSVTKYLFTKLDYFPIERKSDNEQANNMSSIKDMSMFLKSGFSIGIFPEGTTRKDGDNFFGSFDKGFAELAHRNNAAVQPILIYWTKDKKIPVVNFGKTISPCAISAEDIYAKYISEMNNLLYECQQAL